LNLVGIGRVHIFSHSQNHVIVGELKLFFNSSCVSKLSTQTSGYQKFDAL